MLVNIPRAVLRRRLAIFSVTCVDINNDVATRTSGSRTQYQWVQWNQTGSDARLYDPHNMIISSVDTYNIVIPATGNYEMRLQYGAQINTILQETMVTRNRDYTSAEPPESFRLMYLSQPFSNDITAARMPDSTMCIVHLDAGDTLQLFEGGVSMGLLEGIKFTLRQLDAALT